MGSFVPSTRMYCCSFSNGLFRAFSNGSTSLGVMLLSWVQSHLWVSRTFIYFVIFLDRILLFSPRCSQKTIPNSCLSLTNARTTGIQHHTWFSLEVCPDVWIRGHLLTEPEEAFLCSPVTQSRKDIINKALESRAWRCFCVGYFYLTLVTFIWQFHPCICVSWLISSHIFVLYPVITFMPRSHCPFLRIHDFWAYFVTSVV